MQELFKSIFSSAEITVEAFFIIIFSAIVLGAIFSFMCYFKSNSTKSFFVSTALIPVSVAMVIMLVNGNLGAGIAVAGAFSLVRFRSAQGSAREICIIFIAMTTGLALGMGYIAYAVCFVVICGLILIALQVTRILEPKIDTVNKTLRIVIPENLNYTTVFDDVFKKYTKSAELIKVKTTNLGSMFQLTYKITLLDPNLEKEFIDEIRIRNGNLEVMINILENINQEL